MCLNLEALWSTQVVCFIDCEDCKAVRGGKTRNLKKKRNVFLNLEAIWPTQVVCFINCEDCMAVRGGKLAALERQADSQELKLRRKEWEMRGYRCVYYVCILSSSGPPLK